MLRVVAAGALPCTRINRGYKSIGIQPLNRSLLRHVGDGMMRIERDAGKDTGELRPAALHDAVSVCRIRRAQHRERNSAVPKRCSGYLPAVQRVAQRMTPHSNRQLIHILRVEIVPDVIVARTIIAGQISRQRRKNPSRGKRKESSVRDRIHATTPGVVELPLQAMAEALHRGQLKTVVVTVRAGGELRNRAESCIRWLQVRERRKTALAHGLVAVDLG